MTVQELIDELMKVEDKNLLVYASDDEMRGDIYDTEVTNYCGTLEVMLKC